MDRINLKSGLIISEILHRTVMPSETIARVEKYLSYKAITELSCLDDMEIPVFAVIYNDIGNAYWGKGLDRELAKASALMELVERTNSGSTDKNRIIKASYNDMRDRAVSRFDLVPTNIQRDLYTREIYDSLEIPWYPCYSLFQDREVYLPASLVGLNVNEDFSDREDTNGLASGNTIEEAVNHALCELIERHAFDIYYFNNTSMEMIDPFSCRIELIHGLAENLVKKGYSFYLADITRDLPVPVVSLMMRKEGEDPCKAFTYLSSPGCHPHPEIAFLRCITEIAQTRARYLYGKAVFKEYQARTSRPEELFNHDLSRRMKHSSKKGFDQMRNICSKDLKTELDIILDYLKKKGMQVYIADLTSPGIPIPTVRVIVRNLQPVISADMQHDSQFSRVSFHLKDYTDILRFAEHNRKERVKNEDRIIEGDCGILKIRLCHLYLTIRDYDRGLDISEKLYQQDPSCRSYGMLYGEFLKRKKRYNESAHVFEALMKAAGERKDIIEIAYQLVEIYDFMNKPEQSEEYISLILGLYPPRKLPSQPELRTLYIKAQLRRLNSDIKKAESVYQKERSPYHADRLFQMHFQKRDFKKALFYASEVVDQNPELLFGWQRLIDSYIALGDEDRANTARAEAVSHFASLGYSREKMQKVFGIKE